MGVVNVSPAAARHRPLAQQRGSPAGFACTCHSRAHTSHLRRPVAVRAEAAHARCVRHRGIALLLKDRPHAGPVTDGAAVAAGVSIGEGDRQRHDRTPPRVAERQLRQRPQPARGGKKAEQSKVGGRGTKEFSLRSQRAPVKGSSMERVLTSSPNAGVPGGGQRCP